MTHVVLGDDSARRLARESVQRQWNGAQTPVRHIDPLLLLSALVLSGVGLLFIYSATFHQLQATGADPLAFVTRQGISLALGLAAMAAVAAFDYRLYRAWAPVAYLASLGLLLWVLAQGTVVNASKSWLEVGGLQLQPSELAKPALIVMLAALFHERREEALGLRALLEALALAAVPMGLILLQPDFGTFIVFCAITFGVLLLARVRVRFLVALVLLSLGAFGAVLQSGALEDYQVARLTSFVNPEAADPDDVYNVNQAQIAIGAGQLVGQGLFNGSQTTLSYVPENHTDFIFTVVGEETGFLGAALLLAAFAVLLWRALRIAALSRDTLGTLLAGGVIAVFGFQVFINIGMAIGIMPVTGLPLPFVSYGGTSLIGSWIMIGLLENVHMRRLS